MDPTNQQQHMQQQVQENTIVDFVPQQGTTGANSSPTQQQHIPTQTPAVVQQPSAPAPSPQPHIGGGGHKELEPMPSFNGKTEFMTSVEQHVALTPEVAAVGVESLSSMPKLSQREKDMGVRLAKESVLQEAEEELELKTPLSKEEVEKITKGQLLTKNTSNPMLWLALLILRQFQILAMKKRTKK